MDPDRIKRIVELNKQLLEMNKELISAIKARAKPQAIQGIRDSVKAIKGEIQDISSSEADAT